MRRMVTVVLLAVALLTPLSACHKAVTAAPVPGAVNTFDSTIYRALMDAQAAINSFKSDVAAGNVTETPALKTALNQAITDYNAANMLWQAYHTAAGTTSSAPVQAAVTQLQTDVNNLVGSVK